MNMNHEINRLIHFGCQQGMLDKADRDYAVNLLLDLLGMDEFSWEDIEETLETATPILDNLLVYATAQGLVEDTTTMKDLFDTRIMNCLMPRPSEVLDHFKQAYALSPQKATDYFYRLSIASNYIRKSRTDKNIRFKQAYRYGTFEITINLSKPEKDPKEIAKAKSVKNSSYPLCLLCKENVGFSGNLNKPARQNHRIIPLDLDGERYYLQYSPYVYYNEHCIVLNEKHIPMVINEATFKHLLSFVDLFPHYMLGSNADLPIVGGSILTHDHYQGGHYTFPIEGAEVLKTLHPKDYPDLAIELLHWPLTTLRVNATNRYQAIAFACKVLEAWKQYSNPELDILAYSGEVPHNTITPIARKKNGMYQLDLVLRNNRTTEAYPDGIFHPHAHLHHIKKENIGLIEVMGLAVLPARLKDEIQILKECLLGYHQMQDHPEMAKHQAWYEELKTKGWTEENIDHHLREALTMKFVEVLEDAGVFKMDEEGIAAFEAFVTGVCEND